MASSNPAPTSKGAWTIIGSSLLVMLISASWFALGLAFDVVFIVPPILFALGVVGLLIGAFLVLQSLGLRGILAVLNIVGAVGFVVLGLMDYAKREAWSYANHVHDVALAGVAQDDKQLDAYETPIKENLGADTKKEWFGGEPISTQVEEVDRVKLAVDGLVKAKDDPAKSAEMARILTPFAQHYTERAWLLSVQNYLTAADGQPRLLTRLHDAFAPAVAACLARPGLKFPQAFEEACRAQGGDPAPAFEQTFLRLLPVKPEGKPEPTFDEALAAAKQAADPNAQAEKFLQTIRSDPTATLRKPGDNSPDTLDKVYQGTLTAINAQLKKQLDDLYDAAKSDKLAGYQRTAIAHYLFNVVEALHPDEAQKGAAGSPDYIRFVHVVGLNQAVQEINDQAALLRTLGDDLQAQRDKEREAFAVVHRARIEDLKNQAVRLHNAGQLLDDVAKELDKQTGIKDTQQAKVQAQERELAAARARADGAMVELRQMSKQLYDKRNEGRDLLGENLELEKQIRELENKH
ncbi:MAG TPA: hypothetical protein VMS17_01135 [Gemmataceae bacterium]|nr:hypothetical protein [Gemmataceae bacterium]